MSILLDALRKSDEQRRLGRTPDIHSPSGGTPAGGATGPAWVPAVLVTVSALAMAWFGWEQYREPATVTEAAVSQAGAEQSPAAEPGEEELAQLAEAEPASPASGEDSGKDSSAVRKPGLVAGPRSSARTAVESFQADGEVPQAAAAAPPARPRNSRVNQAFQQYAPEPGSPPDTGSNAPPPMAGTAATAAVPLAAGPREQPAATPSQPEPITYWELPQGVRDSMPEMRITVLVYAEQPENRFLLIGGQRLLEGEEYQSGVLLEEIRRGGAVFVYRNYRFLVKG